MCRVPVLSRGKPAPKVRSAKAGNHNNREIRERHRRGQMEVGSYPEIVVPSCRSLFPFLTGATRAAACAFRNSVPDGVMAAQATLTRLVMVQIHVGQPTCGQHLSVAPPL